jgi:D-alanyl-D-alanine carboxypeptidase/D-alanyl-D-alanine-endopeptidase (penicillin-binding protein 4)
MPLTLALTTLAAALTAAPPQDPAAALRALVEAPALAGARVGVMVRDLADGSVLLAHDADFGFMTASNMKLVSSAVALRTLGPGFRFRTTLVATGSLVDGVLDGDLVLIGSGDPTFGGRQEGDDPTAVLRRMVDEAVARVGLREVRGDVLGDDDCHPDEVMGEGWAWNYQGDSYAAQVGGLCFAENTAVLVVTPAALDGGQPLVRIEPPVGYLAVENLGTTAAGLERPRLFAERLRATNRVRVGGRIPLGAEPWRTRISVENPTAFAATALRQVLGERGIRVDGAALDRDQGPARPERYGDETVLATHESAPLAEILVTLNKVSQNLYAEQLLRSASRVARGDGSMTAAAAHAKETLRAFGVDPAGMRIADGSGLSRLDLVRPRQLCDLLAGIWASEDRAVFVPTLPVGGVDGTLAGRFRDGPAHARVLAKTGTISAVAALSGYLMQPDPAAPPRAFSILVNNFTCSSAEARAAIDTLVTALAK